MAPIPEQLLYPGRESKPKLPKVRLPWSAAATLPRESYSRTNRWESAGSSKYRVEGGAISYRSCMCVFVLSLLIFLFRISFDEVGSGFPAPDLFQSEGICPAVATCGAYLLAEEW